MKILYLYNEVMGYTSSTIQQLVSRNHDLHIVHWSTKKLTPYDFNSLKGVKALPITSFSLFSLLTYVVQLDPDLVVVSGWSELKYLFSCLYLRFMKKRVVVGLDGQLTSSTKHTFLALLGKLRIFRCFYSHAWVSGVYQFEYAGHLGFSKDEIVFDLYSCDTSIFHSTDNDVCNRLKSFTKTLVYTGRLESVKGLHCLASAWQRFKDSSPDSPWRLLIVGNGSLAPLFAKLNDVDVVPFQQPEDLRDILLQCHFAILPSTYEPWGVVLHEFACLSLPIIATQRVGSRTSFLIDKYNGFIFPSNDSDYLLDILQILSSMSNEDLTRFSRNSRYLASRISPSTSATNLLSLLT